MKSILVALLALVVSAGMVFAAADKAAGKGKADEKSVKADDAKGKPDGTGKAAEKGK